MELRILFENENLLVIDKPPQLIVFPENDIKEKTLVDFLLERFPLLEKAGQAPRYGIVHRLDRETSGILLVAKNKESLFFFQSQFKERKVVKKYIALLFGEFAEKKGIIETLIGRSPKNRLKQKVYLPFGPGTKGKRMAITEYRVLSLLKEKTLKQNNLYTLVEATPRTGRRHQLRVHFQYLGHPIVGDKIYSFKNQTLPLGLSRHFLHASSLKIKLLGGEKREFNSELPKDLKDVLRKLDEISL